MKRRSSSRNARSSGATEKFTGRLYDSWLTLRMATRRSGRTSASVTVAPFGVETGRTPKLAETLARQIELDIIARDWPIGTQLGTEASLAEEHGVSRAVVREAMRILEHHMVVEPRRGLGGGLVISRPDISAVVPVTGLYLDSQGVTPDTLLEARSAIELAAVALAAERITDDSRRRLREALDLETAGMGDPHNYVLSHDLHILIAELSGNAALSLFVAVLTRLTSEHSAERFSRTKPADVTRIGGDISGAHARIVDAIVAGDAELAQKRMVRHLRAVTSWLT